MLYGICDVCPSCGLDVCSPCIKATMTNKPLSLRTHVKARPGPVIYTGVAFMNEPSIGGKCTSLHFSMTPCSLEYFPYDAGGRSS